MLHKISVQVFLENCVKFVGNSAKLIGLVETTGKTFGVPRIHHQPKQPHLPPPTPNNHHRNTQIDNDGDDSTVDANKRSRTSAVTITAATTTMGNRNRRHDPFPDLKTTPNNCQLLCDGASCSCNRNIRRRAPKIPWLLVLVLLVYPVAIFFTNRSVPATTTTSFFNLFVFITLHFHYVLMVVAGILVVLRHRSAFTDTLSELNSLIGAICDAMNYAGVANEKEEEDDVDRRLSRDEKGFTWRMRMVRMMRSRSIDLGLKCGLVGALCVALSWLNINLPILTADNWITILFLSLILILPTVMLVALSATFYAIAMIIEGLLRELNAWLCACLCLVDARLENENHRERPGNGWFSSAPRRDTPINQLSIYDNVDSATQFYFRTLGLLKRINHFQAISSLVVVLNCFFNIAAQSFAIYMTLSATDTHMTDNKNAMITRTINGSKLSIQNYPLDDPREFAPVLESGYLIVVNSVYILINYAELFITIRASVSHRNVVSTNDS